MQLSELLNQAARAPDATADADPTRDRILDAAVLEAGSVGLQRLTVEDVVRRAGIARMTVYRRFPRRDDLVQALVVREVTRFLAAVSDAIATAEDEAEAVAEGFVAAVRFSRANPMLRRVGETGAGTLVDVVAVDNAAILAMGSDFIARQIARARGVPPRKARWVADVFARLFLSYVALPPSDPDPDDEGELRAFARTVLQPLVEPVTAPPARA